MAVELEWRIDGKVPDKVPREEGSPHRSRRRVWLSLAGVAVLLAGVASYAWWHRRQGDLAQAEAEVQAVAELELRALAEGDTELYLDLQDSDYPAWWEAQKQHAALDTPLPPPLPGLTATTAISVENARVVGDVARVEVVRTVGLPDGGMAHFRALRFYRHDGGGRWLHTPADLGYAGNRVVFAGERVHVACFATDREWIAPVVPELEGLAERFCSLAGIIPCHHRRPLILDFTGTLDAAADAGSALPAPFLVGAPDDEAAWAAWEVGLRELLLDRFIVREVGHSLVGDRDWPRGGELFRARMHEWLRAELGLREPISPDLDLIGEALDTGEWISLGALWYFTFADDDARRRLAEAEIDLLLAFIEEEYGRSQVTSPLHALRLAPRMEALIWQGLGEAWPTFEQRHATYVREVTGRPFEPPQETAAFAEYDLVATCEGPSSLWGLRLDQPEMAPLLAAAGFELHSWSPDGARLLVRRGAMQGGGVYLLEADGSRVRQLAGVPEDVWPIGWSPNGSHVAYSTSGWFTGTARPEGGLVDLETDERVALNGYSFAWSPDGSQLAHVDGAGVIWLAEADGSNPRQVGIGNSVAWSPDGTQIAFFGTPTEPSLKTYDVAAGETTVVLDSFVLYDLFELEPGGTLVLANSLTWSPTGEWIGLGVVQIDETGPVTGGAALVRPDGSDPRALLTRQADAFVTGWSPDGRWLTCQTDQVYAAGQFTSTVLAIDGEVLLEASAAVSWSPDGRYLAVAGMDRLRILEIEAGTWHSFEPPAHCGAVIWNPRGPLHEPVPAGRDTAP